MRIPVALTILTAMFLHGSPLHLVGNMLFLWIFGDNVEEVLGTLRYVAGLPGLRRRPVRSARLPHAPDS